ncbi:hypothetical protein KP509_37G032300 [Ceratopteris richardii]|uniref:Chloride conductance regulatory protein ICln n=1 Tax=Ceratopteris richardii TaxID=49495 RepID=A0A8T2Q7J6_CERRI|nr:hypothetical protein KP509_37G032300 [Ceratopteris richardii]
MASRGLVSFSERDSDGRPRLDSGVEESFHAIQPNMGIVLDDSPIEQPGTLYVTTKRLIWISNVDHHGYAVDFLSLSMHAISRDPEAYPFPCIYTQIDHDDEFDYNEDESSVNQSFRDLSRVQEMRLVPSDPAVLEDLFKALCDCALLNPDQVEEAEGEGEWFFNEDEVLAGAIGHSNGIKSHDVPGFSELHIDDEQFEDAEESDEDVHN